MAVTTEHLPVRGIERFGWAKLRKPAWPAWPRQKVISDSFRLIAFGAALLQMGAFPNGPGYTASELAGLATVAGTYTVLKIAQPFRWQQARALNVLLLAVDIAVSTLLVHLSGSIESPFILYTLLPVLTAALLKDYAVTVTVSLITATYVLIGNIYNPVSGNVLTLQAVNDFLIYLIALGFVAVLPYSVNLSVSRKLRSGAVAEERLRISRDLHDNVCQALCGLRWQVQHLAEGAASDTHLSEKLKRMEMAVDTAERDARELLEVLHTFNADAGFIAHIKHHLELLKRETGIEYELDSSDVPFRMEPLVERELVAICGEALANVRKHSRAGKVRFSIRPANGVLQVKITDDGVGFDDSRAGGSSSHGMTIMRERAVSAGGTLRVTSAHGKGTEIEIEVPATDGDNDV